MTEDEIKRVVDREMDRLDLRRYDGVLDDDRYHDAVADLIEWSEREFRNAEREFRNEYDRTVYENWLRARPVQ